MYMSKRFYYLCFKGFLYLSRMKQKQDMENKIQELTDKNYRA